MKKAKVGLALGGGAARGLAHIGVIDILQREGVPIDLIAGTSIGGLIGALYAREKDCRLIREQAAGMNLRKVLSLADLTVLKSGLFEGRAVIRMLKEIMGSDIDFGDLSIPLTLVATDVITGEEVIINQGSVLEGIRASISIPGIFTLAQWRERYLVDGGLVNPVPVSVAREMGADFTIAVNVMPDASERVRQARTEQTPRKEPNIFNVLIQSFYIGTYALAKTSLESADIVIRPHTAHINPADFHHAEECIRQGELAAEAALPEIKRKLSKA